MTRVRRQKDDSAALPVRARTGHEGHSRSTRPRIFAMPAATASPVAAQRSSDTDNDSPGGVVNVPVVNVQNVATAVHVTADPGL